MIDPSTPTWNGNPDPTEFNKASKENRIRSTASDGFGHITYHETSAEPIEPISITIPQTEHDRLLNVSVAAQSLARALDKYMGTESSRTAAWELFTARQQFERIMYGIK